MRSKSTLFKAASGFPWCGAKMCPREEREENKTVRTACGIKKARNAAAVEVGTRQRAVRRNVRWKMEAEKRKEANKGGNKVEIYARE